MSNVQLSLQAERTSYSVSVGQMAQLIADNLNVPVEAITVQYNLATREYDGPDIGSQYVSDVTVTVDNKAVKRLQRLAGTVIGLC